MTVLAFSLNSMGEQRGLRDDGAKPETRDLREELLADR